jgi:hypothetical protein
MLHLMRRQVGFSRGVDLHRDEGTGWFLTLDVGWDGVLAKL